ncbi:MAG: hypothetical protein ACTSQ7_07335 [Alphaproteobacteria bacterium]
MSEATPPREALRKLLVVETAKEAYTRVFGSPRLLARASLAPFCLSLALIVLSFTVPVVSALGYLIGILGLLPYTFFGVAWHRLTLLGPVAGAPPLMPAWAPRHWRFLGYLLATMLIGSAATAVVFSLGLMAIRPEAGSLPAAAGLMPLAGFAIVAYVMIRLSFVFPAVSVDESYRLRHAWTHTKGQGLRLLGATVIAAVPMVALVWGVNEILGALLFAEPAPGQDGVPAVAQMAAFVEANLGALLLIQAVTAAINYVLMALMVSVISIAFRTCTGWVPAVGGLVVTLDDEES